jgi:hypothetical protein
MGWSFFICKLYIQKGIVGQDLKQKNKEGNVSFELPLNSKHVFLSFTMNIIYVSLMHILKNKYYIGRPQKPSSTCSIDYWCGGH